MPNAWCVMAQACSHILVTVATLDKRTYKYIPEKHPGLRSAFNKLLSTSVPKPGSPWDLYAWQRFCWFDWYKRRWNNVLPFLHHLQRKCIVRHVMEISGLIWILMYVALRWIPPANPCGDQRNLGVILLLPFNWHRFLNAGVNAQCSDYWHALKLYAASFPSEIDIYQCVNASETRAPATHQLVAWQKLNQQLFW